MDEARMRFPGLEAQGRGTPNPWDGSRQIPRVRSTSPLGFAPSMKAKLAFTAISEIPLYGSRAAAISCCGEASTNALEAVPKAIGAAETTVAVAALSARFADVFMVAADALQPALTIRTTGKRHRNAGTRRQSRRNTANARELFWDRASSACPTLVLGGYNA